MSKATTETLINMAQANAAEGFDQRGEYETLELAWLAYRQNVSDTCDEMGCDVWNDRLFIYEEFDIKFNALAGTDF